MYSSPKQVGALTDWLLPSAKNNFTLCTKTDGSLWAVGGRNYGGALGLGDVTNRSSPNQVGILTTWLNLTTGYAYTMATQTNGTLYSWGYSPGGGLGLGNTAYYLSPKQVGSLTTWLNIAAGYYNTLATKTDGTLWSWGKNNVGQLGLGNLTYYSSPKQVGSSTMWAKVFSGYRNTAFAI